MATTPSPNTGTQPSAPYDFANFPRAGFFRRIGAIVYDSLVVVAVLMFAASIALALVAGLNAIGLLTLAEGADHASVLENNWLYRIYLIAVLLWFYGGFWVRGGQTLGMRAWRLRVQNHDGSTLSWRQASIRFLTAVLGLSNLGVLFSRDNLAWQDRAAKCEVVLLSVEANRSITWKKRK